MNHGAGVMSDKDKRPDGPDDATERELIEMEFQSMVENLSLDESAPTSYLDELDAISDSEKFMAPNPAKKAHRNLFAMRSLPLRSGKMEKISVTMTESHFKFLKGLQPLPNLRYYQVLPE